MSARVVVEAKSGHGSSFACEPGDSVLTAALRAGLGFPYECNSGGCGSCVFELIEGRLSVAWNEAPGLDSARRERGFRLACQSTAVADCRIKVRLRDSFVPLIAPSRGRLTLRSRRILSPDLEEFVFQGGAPADFLPGQYAMLNLPGVAGARAYSMCNLPNGNGEWHFIIKRMPNGLATSILFDGLALGSEISFEGPFGLSYLRTNTARDIVLVAGGSGLSPVLSVARAAVRSAELAGRRIRLFHGARSVLDLCARRLLAEEDILDKRIELIEAISHGERETDGWTGERGFIHEVLARSLESNAASTDYYFCGPPLMTNAVHKLLMLELRIPEDQLHFDRFY